jgi:hypothetical protein
MVRATGRRVVILRVFAKKTRRRPRAARSSWHVKCEAGDMSRKNIPAEESFAAWRKDPEYVKAYNSLEEEFSLARLMKKPRCPKKSTPCSPAIGERAGPT